MEQEGLNLLQQAFKGFLKCLGLESGGGENVANDGETVNITDPAAQPLHQEASRSSDPEPSSYDAPIIDPLVEVLSSPIDGSAVTSKDISYNDADTKLVTIDEIINIAGGATVETHLVDLDSGSIIPRLQEVEDLQGDDLLYYDAEIKLTNIFNFLFLRAFYNSVILVRRQGKDGSCEQPGESLVSVYNHFAQLMNDLERNNMKFPIVSVNTKFLNSLQPEWLKYVTQVRLAKKLTVDSFDDLFDYLSQFEKLVNASRAKKLEKSHDPLALVAHTGSSSRNTSSYYVTHPPSVVKYDEEFEQDDIHNHSEDPQASAILLLAKAITQNFSNPTNNRLRASSNTKNQAVVQGDRVNIQSRNFGNIGRNNRRAYVQGEVVEGMNATNETANVQRIVRTPTPGNTSTGQCYNCGGKGHYARNCPKPRVRDSKYFMEQMLLAKQDEAGGILTDEQNDFLFADASRMEEIEELSANICLMARIQPADQNSDEEPSYESAFVRLR
ncbi:retrovirus-related pol polyprotein from transposon TNT 1-94 [Tanacetum coccineum]|uniref:Retrovirus-related pol polyprotein from transposon TNT 1-94 n=1 Tax=Tanacetum coccineum TaxID=301880 RepID=A0ABQ5D2G7_9ASTR